MNKDHEKWERAISIARALGASDESIYKWRQRNGIPASWAVKIALNSDGDVTLADFKELAA